MYYVGQHQTTRDSPITDVATYLAKKPSYEVPKDDRVGCFVVTGRRGDRRNVPQIRLPLVGVLMGRLDVDEKDPRCALNQPSSVQNIDAAVSHGLDSRSKLRDGGLQFLDFDSGL